MTIRRILKHKHYAVIDEIIVLTCVAIVNFRVRHKDSEKSEKRSVVTSRFMCSRYRQYLFWILPWWSALCHFMTEKMFHLVVYFYVSCTVWFIKVQAAWMWWIIISVTIILITGKILIGWEESLICQLRGKRI